jgi:uncharacterized membrane protein YfcA
MDELLRSNLMVPWEIVISFAVIAFVYASVGFGGGSSYLAVMALFALPFKELRLIALLCNIIVVTGGTIIFIRGRQVAWKKIIPFIVPSVPMAYAGAVIKISQHAFFIILGCSLVVSAMLLWIKTNPRNLHEIKSTGKYGYFTDGSLGGGIGFLSGMVGIGGGIFLSPILNLMNWDTANRIAATASVFILVNSLAGIAGQLSHLPPKINYTLVLLLCMAVFTGGQLGSHMAVRGNPLVIRRMTAVLVFIAGTEVLFKYLR